jgi:DNA-binding response OmpR family regulator
MFVSQPEITCLETYRKLRLLSSIVIRNRFIHLFYRDSYQVHGLEAGADDYVVKPFIFEVLLARVRALLRRQQAEHPPILSFADLSLDAGSHTVWRGWREVTLTSLEFKLLQTFLEHPQQVLSKEVLLDRVWGYDFGGNANVVEVYVKQLTMRGMHGGHSEHSGDGTRDVDTVVTHKPPGEDHMGNVEQAGSQCG